MAKMQRWRRSRSAGEGVASVVTADEHDEGTDEATDEVDRTVETVEEDDGVGDGDGVVQVDLRDEPDEPDEPDKPADPAHADQDHRDHQDHQDPEHPEGPDSEEEVEERLDVDRPELPHVPERSGFASALLGGRAPADVLPLQLLQAAHAKQAITTALAVALVAVVSGRPAREVGVVALTVLVGQTILGWHNDIVDRERDRAHRLPHKPLAAGRLDPGTAWYAIVVATLILVPLSITTGIRAGCLYLAAVAIGMLGNVLLRTGILSWWSWAASFALLPAYLSYGGWGGQAVGSPPEPAIVALAAALGVGVHFMRAVWGLVADHEDGWTYLPLRIGLKIGATRLLALSTVYTAGIAIALVVVGARVGLSR
ncbi:UbiA family prenyltransferase [Nocardioides sp. SYSU DS0651]|uniref:UbiA family prenyltransferase n=1 Tax=Nocardioides sp. SYSU DS0651 TaxID=3415955 RepID=UPI003F4B52A6